MAVTSQDEFVDLYEILELATDAEAETIRKRINELYLEAQQNLDHRNAKKRLHFQQMYEIYLPQARHLLLDLRRREEYDRYLTAYRTGNKVVTPEPSAAVPMPETSPAAEEPPLPGMAEVQVDPAVIAAERENIWAKWKQGLELVTDDAPAVPAPLADRVAAAQEAPAPTQEVAPPPNAPPARPNVPPFAQRPQTTARPAPPPPRSTTPATAPAPVGDAEKRTAPPGARPKRPPSVGYGTGLTGDPSPEEVERRKEHERQLELQRSEITRDAAQVAGLISGAISGMVIFVIGCVGLFFLINNLKPIPLGLSSGVFSGILLLVIIGAAAFGATQMRDKAERQKEAELSQLSHEELLRQYRSK